MSAWIANRLERSFGVSARRTVRMVHVLAVAAAAALFVLIATATVAFPSVFPGQTDASGLQIGDIAPRDIHSPVTREYTSDVLTAERQQAAAQSVRPVYDPPDPNVVRQQTQLARQILDFIENVRRDPYSTEAQKIEDANQITALTLDDTIIQNILAIGDDGWQEVDDQIIGVLERVMRESIREEDVPAVVAQLPTQVSVRFGGVETAIVVAIVEDLIRPNTFENPAATEQARDLAVAAVEPERRVFERGQIVVREGELINEAAFEALDRLDLLKPADRRLQEIAAALLASILVMIVTGLYIARFNRPLLDQPRFLALLATIFLIALVGARIFGANAQVYVYPASALALLFVPLIGPEIAIIGSFGLAILIGLMSGAAFEVVLLILVGGMVGALTLRRSERFNSYFLAGLIVAGTHTIVVTIFNQITPNPDMELGLLILYSLINGILSAAVAIAGMYVITLAFNLPTSLKLIELSQPNQPLLQRLLREAPGTYQHSLQVANLGEQAANAVGANAELVRVAALYHDVGKMENPAFFIENQVEDVNPHDVLNDPYRSAYIIISHVTEGDEMARQYRLPTRIRDFIREHHGTTQVVYFYRQAVERAGDSAEVDIEQFTYPGPRPRTRETAILMLADTCESTVRARRPTSKQEIADIVQEMTDTRMRGGQLDDSGLTLNDLKAIRAIFIEMLQAVFHPRINYPAGEHPAQKSPVKGVTDTGVPVLRTDTGLTPPVSPARVAEDRKTELSTLVPPVDIETPRPKLKTGEIPVLNDNEDEEAPLTEVPPLPRTGEHKKVEDNGRKEGGVTENKPAVRDNE
jgi:putative nucleotidyltransferase with HDIG domain